MLLGVWRDMTTILEREYNVMMGISVLGFTPCNAEENSNRLWKPSGSFLLHYCSSLYGWKSFGCPTIFKFLFTREISVLSFTPQHILINHHTIILLPLTRLIIIPMLLGFPF